MALHPAKPSLLKISSSVQRPEIMPLIRMAPKTRQQYLQHVATVLNLHKDTVRFTQHLFARLKVSSCEKEVIVSAAVRLVHSGPVC